jgi:hypothetical protein
MFEDRETLMKVRMIDPPSGWKYGFPKVFPEGVDDAAEWLVANGYPQWEIDACGAHFYVSVWEEERDDPEEEAIIVLELTKREADAVLELVCTASWDNGDYGAEMQNICRALEKVLPHNECFARAKTWFGDLEVGQVFLVEDK